MQKNLKSNKGFRRYVPGGKCRRGASVAGGKCLGANVAQSSEALWSTLEHSSALLSTLEHFGAL